MSLSPEREQQIRDYLEGCQGARLADIPEQFRRYERWLIESDERATVLLAELDRARSNALTEAADFVRDAHFRDGLSVQEIGTALRFMADTNTSQET